MFKTDISLPDQKFLREFAAEQFGKTPNYELRAELIELALGIPVSRLAAEKFATTVLRELDADHLKSVDDGMATGKISKPAVKVMKKGTEPSPESPAETPLEKKQTKISTAEIRKQYQQTVKGEAFYGLTGQEIVDNFPPPFPIEQVAIDDAYIRITPDSKRDMASYFLRPCPVELESGKVIMAKLTVYFHNDRIQPPNWRIDATEEHLNGAKQYVLVGEKGRFSSSLDDLIAIPREKYKDVTDRIPKKECTAEDFDLIRRAHLNMVPTVDYRIKMDSIIAAKSSNNEKK